jgi:hypothetical protein
VADSQKSRVGPAFVWYLWYYGKMQIPKYHYYRKKDIAKLNWVFLTRVDLSRLPTIAPHANCSEGVVDRITLLEESIKELVNSNKKHDTLLSNLCDSVASLAPISATVAPTVAVPEPTPYRDRLLRSSSASNTAVPASRAANSSEGGIPRTTGNTTTAYAPPSSDPRPPQGFRDSRPSTSQNDDGFQPASTGRRQRRVVVGSRAANGQMRGAERTRDLFLYRVHKSISE